MIKFSRHAKRRAKLYNIPDSAVTNILKRMNLGQGEHEIIKAVPGFKYPFKVVVCVEGGTLTVITNYLLKKRREK